MTGFAQDLRHGLRLMRRAPAFTFVAVLTLAIGIGANAAMFGIVDALLFRAPPGLADPGRLVRLQMELAGPPGAPPELSGVVSYRHFTDVRDRVRGLAGAAAYARTIAQVGEGTETAGAPAILASGDYFRVLGARPALGRLLDRGDDREGSPSQVAVVSWDYWQRALAGDPAVVGRRLVLNGSAFTIVGVASRHFSGAELGTPALWVPLGTAPRFGYDARMMRSRFAQWLSVVARLAPGVTREQATAAVQSAVLAARDAGEAPPSPGDAGLGGMGGGGPVRIEIGPAGPGGGGRAAAPPPPRVRLASLAGAGVGEPGPFGGGAPVSGWLLAVTTLVLLIACANVANLMLARAADRAPEMAVRLSLGVGRARLVRQLLTESLLLAALGALAGGALAAAAVLLAPRLVPLPPLPPFLGARTLLFLAGTSALTACAFGVAPALRALRTDARLVIGTHTASRAARSLGRDALVVAQLAASMVLLVAAGLFVRSLRNVRAIDTGFAAEEVVMATVDPGSARLSRQQMEEYWARALERVRRLPGVRAAALGAVVPFQMVLMMPVEVPGRPTQDGRPRDAQADFAGPGYFSALGVRIVEGRAFTEEDRRGGAPVAIVNRTLARRVWGSASPIGQCVRVPSPRAPGEGACHQIVGVAEDARYASLTQEPVSLFYRPIAQRDPSEPPATVLHVRAAGDPAATARAVASALRGLDPAVRRVTVRPLRELLREQAERWRVGTALFTLLGLVGLALAAVGIYGVISYLVATRTRELGVRIALGAGARDVLALVLGQGGRLIAAGVAAGLVLAAAASRALSAAVFGVSALDPLVYAATAALLAAAALAAVLVPARRATRVDPMVAMRAE